MTRNEIRRQARERLSWIDQHMAEFHISEDIHTYHRLLIALYRASVPSYFEAFGWMSIDEADAFDGKYRLGWGELTGFEKDVIILINQEVIRNEEADEYRRVSERAQTVRVGLLD